MRDKFRSVRQRIVFKWHRYCVHKHHAKELLDSERRSHRTRVFHLRKNKAWKTNKCDAVPSKKSKNSLAHHAGVAPPTKSDNSYLYGNDCAGTVTAPLIGFEDMNEVFEPETQNSDSTFAERLPRHTTGFIRTDVTCLADANTLERRDLHYFTVAIAKNLRPYPDGIFFSHIVICLATHNKGVRLLLCAIVASLNELNDTIDGSMGSWQSTVHCYRATRYLQTNHSNLPLEIVQASCLLLICVHILSMDIVEASRYANTALKLIGVSLQQVSA